MAYNYNTTLSRNSNNSTATSPNSSNSTSQFGRVVYVILSAEDRYCKDLSMINGVFYSSIQNPTDDSNISSLPFALAGNTSIKTAPVKGEIIEIQAMPGVESLTTTDSTVRYWTKVVNIWNHPHHNATPDTLQDNWKDTLLGDFEEQRNINPLLVNAGDVLIEGRLSQSIRLGGGKGPANTIITPVDEQSPVLLISNGQKSTSDGSELIQEDINEDYNSMYFLSNHRAPIQQVNSKRDSYNKVPTTPDQYKGNQVILNAGRLLFNAKEESVLLLAKESVGLIGNTVNLDGKEYICLDADRVLLGKGARTTPQSTQQPVVLGKQLENWLGALLDALDSVATAMQSSSAVGAGPVTQLNVAGPVLKATIQSLKTQYRIFQSKKVFTE